MTEKKDAAADGMTGEKRIRLRAMREVR